MKRKRFSKSRLLGFCASMRRGARTADLARKHGVSEATIYNWKAKYGGMDVSDAKRLKALEEENAKLKKLLAEKQWGIDEALTFMRAYSQLTNSMQSQDKATRHYPFFPVLRTEAASSRVRGRLRFWPRLDLHRHG